MEVNKKRWQLYVVPHTHWDKEWYFTKQDSDILLCENIDKILELFETGELKKFNYDGQWSVIEDYLSYDKSNEKKLINYIKNRQLIVGPWYTQPDFFNVTSESIIRNLLIGTGEVEKLQASHLNVAYVPDSFGHNDQMPQIYKKFGLHDFIFWRGISQEVIENNGIINNWTGVDGSSVLSYNLLYGYWSFGANFPYNQDLKVDTNKKAKEFLKATSDLLEQLKQKSEKVTNKILIPIGGDQAPPIANLKIFIEALNQISSDHWILSDYEEFMQELKDDISDIPTISGELKKPYMSRIHRTIGSQRQDIKMLMKKAEVELFYNLEPMLTFDYLLNGSYEKKYIDKVLRWILSCQAHDSAGGCNSDRTNDDIENRLNKALDTIRSLQTFMLKKQVWKENMDNEDFIIFNPELNKKTINKKITLFSKFESIKILNKDNKDFKYIVLEKKHHNDGMVVKPSISGEDISRAEGFYEYEVFISDLSIEAFEKTIFQVVQKSSNELIKYNQLKNPNQIVEILDSKILINKKFKLYFEAEHDYGDSYDFSPESKSKKIISNLVSQSILSRDENGITHCIVNLSFEIPESEKNKRIVHQNIQLEIIFSNENICFININTKNVSTEVRWRVLFEKKEIGTKVISDQCYSVVEKQKNPELKNWQDKNWKEAPVDIHSFESFISCKNNLAIYNNGLNEFEIIDNNTIALTLYRSVSCLGRNNLLWRPGRASGTSEFNISTEGSKILIPNLHYELLIDLREGVNSASEAKNFITDVMYYQKQELNKLFKRFDRFLLDPKITNNKNHIDIKNVNSAFLIKTIKKAENNENIIIRGFNPTNDSIKISFEYKGKPLKWDLCDLKENVIEKDCTYKEVKPNSIETILIRKDDLNDR